MRIRNKHDYYKINHHVYPTYGLCYLRVPTWALFRLQFYFNGHNWLENKLIKHGITYTKLDNAFHTISDFAKAQELSDKIRI